MKNIVAIERCADYREATLRTALERCLGQIGGMDKFVKRGQKVLLKPNLLRKARPEEAVTTHPAFVGQVVRMVQECGGKAVIGDSPGAALPHTRLILARLYRACGLENVATETGAELALDTDYDLVDFPGGRMAKKIEIIRAAREADVIINLPKFKTHVYTRLTGAVKNLFGLLPGLIKPAYHAKLGDLNRFSSMLVDVMELARSALTIVDGIWGMEGDGPGTGPRREMGLIVAGAGPPAVDVVLSQIMAMEPLSVSTVRECVDRGLLAPDLSGIEVRGESLGNAVQEDMPVPSPITDGLSFARLPLWQKPALPVAKWLLTTRPRVNREKCVSCEDCLKVCPVKAVTIGKGRVAINYLKCLRCYCCHETCSRGAIELVRPLLQRILV